jgi:hypothetical protein
MCFMTETNKILFSFIDFRNIYRINPRHAIDEDDLNFKNLDRNSFGYAKLL